MNYTNTKILSLTICKKRKEYTISSRVQDFFRKFLNYVIKIVGSLTPLFIFPGQTLSQVQMNVKVGLNGT